MGEKGVQMREEDLACRTDILIVGGGGAGIRAAITAARGGCQVIVANKGPIGRSGTTPMAMEAFQSVCIPGDSAELHFQDTVEGGRYLGDENLITALVRDAPKRARDLESYGVHFKKKDDGSYDPMHHPGQRLPRTLFTLGGGFGMLSGLVHEARRYPEIQMWSDVFVFKLCWNHEGYPSGAIYLDIRDGKVKTIHCRAIILATGGYEELWSFSDASIHSCGDGIILAYESGAELVDLEMLQYYPTIVIYPPSIQGTLFQYELVVDPQILGGRLLNGLGKPFIEGIPLRDALIRAIWQEVQMGRGTEHGGVFMELTHSSKNREALTAALEKWQPNQFHYMKDMGIDLREVRIEVAPHAHFTLGGVTIDEKARTTVPGLFAAGEVAGNLHGANRVSGNALAETQVFGAIAGESAAAFARDTKNNDPAEMAGETEKAKTLLQGWGMQRDGSLRPRQVIQQLKEIMWRCCGVERDEEGVRRGIAEIEILSRDDVPRIAGEAGKAYPQGIVEGLELTMMARLAPLVLASAAFRRESRGNHMRKDFPSSAKEAKHIVIRRGEEPMERNVKREDSTPWGK